MEGYDFDFVGEDIQEYKCPICLMLLRDAVLMPCSHSACTPCLKKWGDQTDSSVFRCPSCQTIYDKENVNEKNRFIDRIITTSLKVKCKHHMKTCEWTGTISDFEFHEASCLYTSVVCEYLGCNETVCRKDLMEHQEVCPYRVIQCEFCSFYFPHNQLEEHHTSCDYVEVTCPQSCQFGSIQRKYVQTHIDFHCPNTEIKCPFHEMGCLQIVLRKNIENHFSESMMNHTQILLGFSFDLKTEIQQLKNISASQNDEIEELKRIKIEQRTEIKELKKFKSKFQIELEKMKGILRKISELEEELKKKSQAVVEQSGANQVVMGDVEVKDTQITGEVERKNTTKKRVETVKLHEDKIRFTELNKLLFHKENMSFGEKIYSKPGLALLCNPSGESLLHGACAWNNTSCMDVLLRNGCPINHEDKDGLQPIHYAARNGSIDAAKILFSIDQTLVNSINSKDGMTPLHLAANRDQKDFVKFLLQKPGIQVDEKDHSNKMADDYGSQRIKKVIRQQRSKHL